MKRLILGTAVGFLVWSFLWLGGGQAVMAAWPEPYETFTGGGALTETGPLAASVGISILCSLVAGFLAAALARDRARSAVTTLIVLLLLVGIGVQASVWERMPLWYHLTFLALLVPVCALGAGLRRGAAPQRA